MIISPASQPYHIIHTHTKNEEWYHNVPRPLWLIGGIMMVLGGTADFTRSSALGMHTIEGNVNYKQTKPLYT